jgi:steroid delta-isomerase-like uncharacterized protein
MTTGAGAEAAERVLEARAERWSAHDVDHLLPLFTEDVVYEDVTFGVVNRGQAELRAFAEGVFPAFPEVRFELASRFVAGDRAGLEWVMTGTQATLPGQPTVRKPFSVRGATILELRAERIRRGTDYGDLATLLKQLGLMSAG